MTWLLAVGLLIAGSGATVLGLHDRRPALVLLGAAVIVSHGLPLAMFDAASASATMLDYRIDATGIGALASFAWLLGYWLLGRRGAVNVPPPAEHAPRAWQAWHWSIMAALALLIALAPGGPIGFAEAGFLRVPVGTTLFSATWAFTCLGALTTTLVALDNLGQGQRAPWLSMTFILLVFWLLGGRTQLAITAASFALLYLAHGRVPVRRLLLPGLVLALLAVQTLSFRLTLQGEETSLAGALPITLAQMSLLEGYALSARHAFEAGFHPGHYGDVIQQILPRALFPDKPLQLSRELRLMEARDMLGGLTPGLAGEAFTAGGYVAVATVGLGFGAALAGLDKSYARLKSLAPLQQALVVSLIPLLAVFVLRGGFDTGIFRLALFFGGVGLLGLFGRSGHSVPAQPVA